MLYADVYLSSNYIQVPDGGMLYTGDEVLFNLTEYLYILAAQSLPYKEPLLALRIIESYIADEHKKCVRRRFVVYIGVDDLRLVEALCRDLHPDCAVEFICAPITMQSSGVMQFVSSCGRSNCITIPTEENDPDGRHEMGKRLHKHTTSPPLPPS